MSSFKTRARTVEMLGRQQIAGIPTAISEVFKNAHDAYADRVEADFLPRDQLLVIRDDGFGMTLDDFEQRWLTLGTDSKVLGGIGYPVSPIGKEPRVMLGEKGIGRLAVAIIGPQVLILSRAKREGQLGNLIAAFINWSAFDLPGINLDEVEVPVRTFPGGALPTTRDIEALVEIALANVESMKRRTDTKKIQHISEELVAFGVNVTEVVGRLKGPTLRDSGHGTHFYISPTDAALAADLEPPGRGAQPSLLVQNLIGFSNTMTPNHERPSLDIIFRNHKSPAFIEDVISSSEFFTPDEFLHADHYFRGEFDNYGQFNGVASIYGQRSDYTVSWKSGKGRPLRSGPFRFNLAVMQGKAIESKLEPDEYNRISRKLEAFGGVYIYKDGIRVLPYGRQDYDYLDIELNRSKGAGYYYYSYRNLFGAVELCAADNPTLREKAGREGFQDNAALRDFQAVLKNFFLQSAADFFRKGGAMTSLFEEQRAELSRVEKARREREKQSRERRRKFLAALDRAFARISQGEIRSSVESILAKLRLAIEQCVAARDVDGLLSAERTARKELSALRTGVSITLPRGLALSKDTRREWGVYLSELEGLDSGIFQPAETYIANAVSEAALEIGGQVNLYRRFMSAVDELAGESQQRTRAAGRELDDASRRFTDRLSTLRSQAIAHVAEAVDGARFDLSKIDYASTTEADLVSRVVELEDSIRVAAERSRSAMESITSQMNEIVWYTDDQGEVVTSADMAASAEEELLAMREQVEQDLEMAQLGMAVAVIDHEFQTTIRSIRAGLRQLKVWSDLNPPLSETYSQLRTSFDHLDGYLTLFTPLQRRLRRTKTEVRGSDIAAFLQSLFGERLGREDIDLETTPNFRKASIYGFPSTFYPVFVNLVDNAIFWLENSNNIRKIALDTDGLDLLVSDTGPGVPTRDAESIFDAGFTRKPGGRGLGLNISRQALRANGYDLTLDRGGRHGGATFRISKQKDD